MAASVQQENIELKQKLRTFGAIMHLTRDAFARQDLASLGVHIVNNTRVLLQFDRSVLLDMQSGKGSLVAQYALSAMNTHTEYAVNMKKLSTALLPLLPEDASCVILEKENELYSLLCEKIPHVMEHIFSEMNALAVVPLRSPRNSRSIREPFLWIMEYKGEVPRHINATLSLLAGDFGNALWSHAASGYSRQFTGYFKKLTFGKVLLALLIVFLIALFTVNVEHTVSAEFVVKSRTVHASYAWFDCIVRKCYFNDGDRIRKGDKILEYDTERMKYLLASSIAQKREAEAQYETESKDAFTNREKLGRLKVLKYKSQQAAIAIEEAKWYLENSIVKAPADGILALAGGSADSLSGRALHLGEKQFELLSEKDMIAEIMVNEKDASVLSGTPQIVLFLHTRPEEPIKVEILSSRFYPELTESNIYSYHVKAKMLTDISRLRYGMRGIARVQGEKVKLGYYLFRGAVLWWRGI
ncbi:MAG: hypothetical protein IKA79_09975 [Lentisphaeria bacterium]|nr:hypothetical protein [Lentisphaeria bacterium]